jgi:hypothetical protein
MRHQGDLIPHINVTTVDGGRFAYSDIWQRKNLVLVSLPHEEADDCHVQGQCLECEGEAK